MSFHFVVLPAIFLRIVSTGQRLFLGPLEKLWHVRAAQPGAVVDALQGQLHPVIQLINPDIGVSGVKGNAASGLQMGTRHTPSCLKKQRLVDPAFEALVQNSVDMAAAAKKHADASELSSLSATLRNLKDACADPEILRTVEDRLRLVLEMGSAARLAPAVRFPGGSGGAGGRGGDGKEGGRD